jgi:hypothetical protein
MLLLLLLLLQLMMMPLQFPMSQWTSMNMLLIISLRRMINHPLTAQFHH